MADQTPDLTDAIEAGGLGLARLIRETAGYPVPLDDEVEAIVTAAAPLLVAEGRRQAAAAIREAGRTTAWSREDAEHAARIAEGEPC